MADQANKRNGRYRLAVVGSLVLYMTATAHAQQMTKARIQHIASDFVVTDIDNREWKRADDIEIATYWDGKPSPKGRRAKARMLWSSTALYVRFEADRVEPLIVSDKPLLTAKTMNLWDRDVVEVFVAADRKQPRKYLEFEVAPTGEWIDLAIDYTGPQRKTDWDFKSGMESSARIEKDRLLMTMKLPWTAFGATPKAGDLWLGNLFRCVGKDPTRGYMSWRPTMSEQPNFHVPEKFGEFEFVK